ncbi:MAG: hypothetical protein AAF965_02400 [Pseudomonadota bacterium]
MKGQNWQMVMHGSDKLTRADHERIAKRARRKIGSEVSLILSAGFAVLMVVLFVFGDVTFFPVAEYLGARPTFVWVTLAAGLSAFWATAHYFVGSKKIAAAREFEATIRRAYQDERDAEIEAKINAMKDVECTSDRQAEN